MANPSRRIVQSCSPLVRTILSRSTVPNGSTNPRNYYSSSSSSSGFSNSESFLRRPRLFAFHEYQFSRKTTSLGLPPAVSSSSSGNNNTSLLLGFKLGDGNGKHLYRCFSSNLSSRGGGNNGGSFFTKAVVDKPLSAVKSTFLRYRDVVGLQIEGFWRRHYVAILGTGAFVLCIGLWRFMFGVANTFIGFSEGMAKYGFLALSSAIVAFAGLYVRSRFTINPDRVYRIAMRKLNTSAGILEVLGTPLSGTDLRAYVMSAGGLKLKKFKPTLGSKRCFLIFPIQGSERRGLVSVEVKKKKGQYDMKLLAVDVPMAAGPDQRFFLIGDEEEYKVGGGLISELRDPIVKAMAAVKEFEALDEKEDEEDAEREVQEAERKNREEVEKLERGSG